MDIQVKNLDHLGIVAGIIDQIGLVEEIDRQLEQHPQQIISTGQVVKAMILNGLGFVSYFVESEKLKIDKSYYL